LDQGDTDIPVCSVLTHRQDCLYHKGKRVVVLDIEQYNLDALIAIGFYDHRNRRSEFRQWAIRRLKEYLLMGCTMVDERSKKVR
jgi:hypothetical protein